MSATGSVPSGLHHEVILVPGAVLPAELAYGALLEALGDDVVAVAKDLEVYAGDEPPPNYTLDVEVEGVLRTAEAAGFERFHLVGYSAGGASSLAFAARHPDRLRSLALLEPAWAGNEGLDPAEEAVWREYDRIMTLPPGEMMRAFMRANLRPGVELPPPPPGPTPPWMARPPGRVERHHRRVHGRRARHRRASPFGAPRLLRPRRPQQPRPVCEARRAPGRPVSRLHRRGVRGPPPLRPATPGRARAPRPLDSAALGASRKA